MSMSFWLVLALGISVLSACAVGMRAVAHWNAGRMTHDHSDWVLAVLLLAMLFVVALVAA